MQTISADARMLIADGAKLDCSGQHPNDRTCSGQLNKDGNGANGGTYDGLVTLITASNKLDFHRSDNFATSTNDGMCEVEHEIDEILGVGGGVGSDLPSNTDLLDGVIGDEELFRYKQRFTPSLSTAPERAHFLINGGRWSFANFHHGFDNCAMKEPKSWGDFADWANTTANTGPNYCGSGLVQDEFACPRQIADISLYSSEGLALQAIATIRRLVSSGFAATIVVFQALAVSFGRVRGCPILAYRIWKRSIPQVSRAVF